MWTQGTRTSYIILRLAKRTREVTCVSHCFFTYAEARSSLCCASPGATARAGGRYRSADRVQVDAGTMN
eukprot:5227471-Heterocapsa_arctica.AAC.1